MILSGPPGRSCHSHLQKETIWYPDSLLVIPSLPSETGEKSDRHREPGLGGCHSAGRWRPLQQPWTRIRPQRGLLRNPRGHGILPKGCGQILSEAGAVLGLKGYCTETGATALFPAPHPYTHRVQEGSEADLTMCQPPGAIWVAHPQTMFRETLL